MKSYYTLIIAAILTSANVDAADALEATSSWTLPTAREDGTALTVAEIKEIRMYSKNADGTYTKMAAYPPSTLTVKLPATTGTKSIVVRAVDTIGLESADSNVVKVWFSGPKSPSLTVTITAP